MSKLNLFEIDEWIKSFLKEDDLYSKINYALSLPSDEVQCSLKIKSDLLLVGLPFFKAVFKVLGHDLSNCLDQYEAQSFEQGFEIHFKSPFNIALCAERVALNLLQHTSSIATYSQKFIKKLEGSNIKLLDTRKTTPGLRSIEKYATHMAGVFNHRFSQVDIFMIKDNHKKFFGSLEKAHDFFTKQKMFYTPIICEIHDLGELERATKLGINYLMLDNFSPNEIKKAVMIKQSWQNFEISGGISLENIESYKIPGVDAISVGAIIYNAPHVDISLKYEKSL